MLSLFVLIVMAVLLCACGESDPETPATDTTTEGTTTGAVAEDPKDLPLFSESGKFNFTIVRPEFEVEGVINAAAYLRTELSEIVGSNVLISDDFLQKGQTEHDSEAYEILFGLTNYPESAALYKGLNYGSYRIEVSGNKIVIAAADAEAASDAAMDFLDHVESVIKNSDDKTISTDYAVEKISNALTSRVPVYNYGTFDTTYSGAHKDIGYIYKSTSPEDFNNYVTSSTTDGGCTLYASSQMGNNLSATLTNGKAVINVFYTAADKKVRVIIESSDNTALPAKESDRSASNVCKTLLCQLGLEQPYDGGQVFTPAVANYNNGMGYIFRLADGSFVIIDGGFNKTKGADMIYNKLKELAPDKNNIVISAWIMSHQHGDHVGAFRKFTEMYKSKVTLKNIIYNFPTSKELSGVGESSGNTGTVSAAYQQYSGCRPIIAHPGQVHYISNAKIEVLHTMDLMRPRSSYAGGNSFNICIKITIDGQTFLFPGDSHTDMTPLLIKNYGSYLKSDFVQVVHHGATGASNEFYQAVDPTVVIWPLGTWDYYPWRRYETYNSFLFSSQNVKEIVLAGHTDRVFELPYTFPTEKVLPPEIEVTWNYMDGKN